MSLGLYIAVPFCRSKCSFCNFASGVFGAERLERYSALLCREIQLLRSVEELQALTADTVYWGGGTPSLLPGEAFGRIDGALRQSFALDAGAEYTVEAAPGTLSDAILRAFLDAGVNRISLGAQSFVDAESRAVGRLHTRAVILEDIRRLRSSGFDNINIDLIAGLPHQTMQSWKESVREAIAADVPHVSVYMLEVDDESRLGTELLAGGARFHAHHVPDEDLIADMYSAALEWLAAAGLEQYEISNFARSGFESRHNERYWLRRPYVGFGVDAHSMLARAQGGDVAEVRWANVDSLEAYFERLERGELPRRESTVLTADDRTEEQLFLGLRRNAGVDLEELSIGGGAPRFRAEILTLVRDGLLQQTGNRVSLTARGRLCSNEVFVRFLGR
jgi:oxygen-independent coproporphyrinogen-3 oxidase